MSDRVLITCRQMQNVIDEFRRDLEEHDIVFDLHPVVQQPTEEELIGIIGDYDGMIAGDDPLTKRVLEHADRMRIISKWGVGIDGIDVAAAEARGIKVTNTPGVFGDDVADVAAGYLVMLARQLHRIDAAIRDGGWWKHEGIRLTGKTLGIVGFGAIGRAVARRGVGFGMKIAAYDVHPDAAAAATAEGFEALSMDELLAQSDFVVLCSPLSGENRHMLDESAFARMRPGSYVVNVARGPLIDETALVAALDSGRLAGAALDVFEDEPLAPEHPLRSFPQCVLGSHNGSNTSDGVRHASAAAVANLIEGLKSS